VTYPRTEILPSVPSNFNYDHFLGQFCFLSSIAMTKIVKFYFDAISPYAWLAWRPLMALTKKQNAVLQPVPVLFA